MSLELQVKNIELRSEYNLSHDAKSEGNDSDEEEFQGEILAGIIDEERKVLMQEDASSYLSSLPSQTDEESVICAIKSKYMHPNQLTLIK